ncbi:hypothetical protein ACNKHQ_04340 [Shigella flexneri]
MSQLTHINAAGEAHMVDVSAKAKPFAKRALKRLLPCSRKPWR